VVELIQVTAATKDGPALCLLFMDIINRLQLLYMCFIYYFVTDADGGSKKGQNLLGVECPWILTPSCFAHQVRYLLNMLASTELMQGFSFNSFLGAISKFILLLLR